jgi:hypothetical protein
MMVWDPRWALDVRSMTLPVVGDPITGIKEEFDMYVRNAELTDFLTDKCPQYHDLTDSFIRKFKYVSHRTSHDVIFNLYEKPFRMSVEEFNDACRIPSWGHALNLVNQIAMNFS